MQDKNKKQVKFYSDLSAEEKADIIYLPDVSKAVSSKREKKDIESDATIVQNKKAASSDSSFVATEKASHPFSSTKKEVIPFPYSSISNKDNLSQKEENRTLESFRDSSSNKNKKALYSNETLSDSLPYKSNPSTSSTQADNGKPYYELLEKEKKNVLYLPDFFKKKAEKQLSYQGTSQNKGAVIPFPVPKIPPQPAAVEGISFLIKSQNVVAFACLLLVAGMFMLSGPISNGSKKFMAEKIAIKNELRVLAHEDIDKWIKKQTAPKPSHIIQYMKKKEIKIIKAVSSSHSMNNP